MDFKASREKAGLTLEQLAKISGYSVATINGLECHDAGSARLRKKLSEILSPAKYPEAPVSALIFHDKQEPNDEAVERALHELTEIRRRINNLEDLLRKLKK